MKTLLSQLIDDFHERQLPDLYERQFNLTQIKGKANVVIGMRRTGKTWFCYQKIKQLLDEKIEKEKIIYLNFEDDRLLDFNVAHFQNILDVYFAKYPRFKNETCYFFFDEIQRIDNWESFIRRLIDTENVNIFITGSSSKLLSNEIATCLRGRSITIVMYPFNFHEFLKYHKIFSKIPKTFGSKNASKLRQAISLYLKNGGFPEIQLLEKNARIEILQGYVDSVLLNDIVERYKINNILVIRHLLRHIMNSSSEKFSINKFYNTMKSLSIKCSKDSLYSYLEYLTDAFILYKVPLYTRSEKTRLVNPPKIYTIDTGLLQAMIFRNSADYGPLLENLVFMHLKRIGYDISYVNTKNGFETDFFARHPIHGKTKLIQVCWDMSYEKTFNREIRGLSNAMEELSISNGTIVTWDDEKKINNQIDVVPVWKWLLELEKS